MFNVSIDVSIATANGVVDACEVARWIGEALDSMEPRNTDMEYHVHRLDVVEEG